MKRTFTRNRKIQAVEDSARDETAMLAWLVQTPFGKVTPVYATDCVGFLGTLTRAGSASGLTVTLQKVNPKQHQSRHLIVRNVLVGGGSVAVKAAGGGKINGYTGSIALAPGYFAILIVTPDADNDWLGLIS